MVVDKMDKQFQADLNTRRGANALIKRSAQMYSDLVVLQKGYTSYNDIIWDMRDNARRNRMAIGKNDFNIDAGSSLSDWLTWPSNRIGLERLKIFKFNPFYFRSHPKSPRYEEILI